MRCVLAGSLRSSINLARSSRDFGETGISGLETSRRGSSSTCGRLRFLGGALLKVGPSFGCFYSRASLPRYWRRSARARAQRHRVGDRLEGRGSHGDADHLPLPCHHLRPRRATSLRSMLIPAQPSLRLRISVGFCGLAAAACSASFIRSFWSSNILCETAKFEISASRVDMGDNVVGGRNPLRMAVAPKPLVRLFAVRDNPAHKSPQRPLNAVD